MSIPVNPLTEPSLLDGLYYGALLALVVYNLAVWVTIRERTHLLYVGFVASLGLSSFAWDGFALRYLWPGAEAWNRASLVFLDSLAAIFGIALARAYLATPLRAPRLDAVLRGVLVLAALAIPLSGPATWLLGIEMMGLVTFVGPPALLVSGIVAWQGGFAPARTYLLAQSCLLTGLVVEVAADHAGGGGPAWTEYGTYGGALLMAFVFSHGLSVRYRESLRERDRLEAERRALELVSQHDGLTELWNRRRFDEYLAEVWRRAIREDGVVSLLLVDVDFFKPFNDGVGHTAGDEVLRRVARALAGVPHRPEHLVARYGGEEFAVVLPGVSPEFALGIAETMRAAVAELAIPHPASGAAPHVTISVGVGSLVPDEDVMPKQLVDAADAALYEAKARGRDQVRRAEQL